VYQDGRGSAPVVVVCNALSLVAVNIPRFRFLLIFDPEAGVSRHLAVEAR